MSSNKVNVRFTTNYDVSNENHVLGVLGSYKYLGSWDPKQALLLQRRGTHGCWSCVAKLPLSTYFEWKLIVIDKLTRQVQRWEECCNRWNWIDRGPIEIIAAWNYKELIRCSSARCLIGYCWCTTIYTKLSSFDNLVDVTFKIIGRIHDENEALSLIGSSGFLGDWNPALSRLFPRQHNPVLTIQLPMNTHVEWKLVILNSRYRNIVSWEDHKNRVLNVQKCPLEVGVVWNSDECIGHKCFWTDSTWSASPCPCNQRRCRYANVCKESDSNQMLGNVEQCPSEGNASSTDSLCFQLDKRVHFFDESSNDKDEIKANVITSAENIDGQLGLSVGLDGFSLDEIYDCRWAAQNATQKATTEALTATLPRPAKTSQPPNRNKDQEHSDELHMENKKDTTCWFCSKDLFEQVQLERVEKGHDYLTQSYLQCSSDDETAERASKPNTSESNGNDSSILGSPFNEHTNNSCLPAPDIARRSGVTYDDLVGCEGQTTDCESTLVSLVDLKLRNKTAKIANADILLSRKPNQSGHQEFSESMLISTQFLTVQHLEAVTRQESLYRKVTKNVQNLKLVLPDLLRSETLFTGDLVFIIKLSSRFNTREENFTRNNKLFHTLVKIEYNMDKETERNLQSEASEGHLSVTTFKESSAEIHNILTLIIRPRELVALRILLQQALAEADKQLDSKSQELSSNNSNSGRKLDGFRINTSEQLFKIGNSSQESHYIVELVPVFVTKLPENMVNRNMENESRPYIECRQNKTFQDTVPEQVIKWNACNEDDSTDDNDDAKSVSPERDLKGNCRSKTGSICSRAKGFFKRKFARVGNKSQSTKQKKNHNIPGQVRHHLAEQTILNSTSKKFATLSSIAAIATGSFLFHKYFKQ